MGLSRAGELSSRDAAVSYVPLAQTIQGLLSLERLMVPDTMDWIVMDRVLRPKEAVSPPRKKRKLPGTAGTTGSASLPLAKGDQGAVVDQLAAPRASPSEGGRSPRTRVTAVPENLLPGDLANDPGQDVNEWLCDLTGVYLLEAEE